MKVFQWLLKGGLIFFTYIALNAQKIQLHTIDVTSAHKEITRGKLKLGGNNILGESYEVNNYYIIKNNQPYIPIMGEFHFCRYPSKYWDESIKKIKAGGIDIIATYVFWIIHEEKEGKFDWKGNKDLRKFIELCAANNMKVILRIGPFCHGEIRNGGLPDWLLGKPLVIRSNDTIYFQYVEKFFRQIGQQVEGLLFYDGGPIIGIQIENEYQHSASPWGITYPGQPEDWTAAEQHISATQAGVANAKAQPVSFNEYGLQHMRNLKKIAESVGLITPLYTVTGWGYAAIVDYESLPVTGAYPYPTWAPKDLSTLYLYKDIHNNPDYAPVRYNPSEYPNLSAEIGGGIMVRYNRRPYIPPPSIDALINRFLGSGSNGIGYYMYHGGSTPQGHTVFYSDEAYGYPKISYDFQAPIGEYGQLNPSYFRIRPLHMFIKAFENELAPMPYIRNVYNPKLTPQNISDLRYAVRSNGNSGFIFMLNYQDHLKTKDINNIQFSLNTKTEKFIFPSSPFTLKSEENAIFPFNLQLSQNTKLLYATVQPLTKFKNNSQLYYVFFTNENITPEIALDSSYHYPVIIGIKVHQKNNTHILKVTQIPAYVEFENNKNEKICLLILDKKMAQNSHLIEFQNSKFLLTSNAIPLVYDKKIDFIIKNDTVFKIQIFPKSNIRPAANAKMKNLFHEIYNEFEFTINSVPLNLQVNKIAQNKYSCYIPVQKPYWVNDYFLQIDYTGDIGLAFINGKLIADHFYYGKVWEIGLKQFIDDYASNELVFYFRPIYKNAPYLDDFETDKLPAFGSNTEFLEIRKFILIPEYKVRVSF